MTHRTASRIAAAAAAVAGITTSSLALAHPGHGLEGAHWHATDAAVYIALALAVGAAIWLGRK
jgi:hypothetical protein